MKNVLILSSLLHSMPPREDSTGLGASLLPSNGGGTSDEKTVDVSRGNAGEPVKTDGRKGHVFGGVRVSRFSRSANYMEKLPSHQKLELHVWRALHGEHVPTTSVKLGAIHQTKNVFTNVFYLALSQTSIFMVSVIAMEFSVAHSL